MTNQYQDQYMENMLDSKELEAMKQRQLAVEAFDRIAHRVLTIILYGLGISTLGAFGMILVNSIMQNNLLLEGQIVKLGYFTFIGFVSFMVVKLVQKIFYEGME